MTPRSLALQTELGLWSTRGNIVQRPGYIVVRTPSDYGYFFGNLLLLAQAPTAADVPLWQARFAEEFAGLPVRHVTLWWDQGTLTTDAEQALVQHGFTIERVSVMSQPTRVMTARTVDGITLQELTAAQAEQLADLGLQINQRHDEAFTLFHQRRARWQKQLITRGLARFWGAFADGKLVASLGMFYHNGLARFQDVQTAATFRRRGIASALLCAAMDASTAARAQTAIIHAEPGDAARLYESLGFAHVATAETACRYPLPVTV
ncbi:MAG TPA: GNAT family N-acetyltransferase [Kofleriaceae bacterium]|nr:GNAT family N-acetyltransferase [Kofleriaceae bacterium]